MAKKRFLPDAPQNDELLIPRVGAWSKNKHHFLRRYLDAFTTAMKAKKWSGLHYIDLFAGAGIEDVEGCGFDWGSPLIAAQLPNRFTRLHLCELDKQKFAALCDRLARFEQPKNPQIICGDANTAVKQIIAEIPTSTLSVAFLDPYGLTLHFETLQALSTRNTDLILFFPDHLDALRNWENVYAGQKDSNLNRVLGTNVWHELLTDTTPDKRPEILRQLYEGQIGTLGYKHFDYQRISLPNGRFLYRLIFASRSETGVKIWHRISREAADGQRSFDFID